LKEYGGCSSIG